ncbi:hypothetical protein B0A54_07135 [Friedmanniomyces endolithicus]|uniref:Uncharacterized protein n=1 Tax=Friedmanniomyces endolithicus TaxID=329885 RepID=A0A4V5N989_9PEZI|nr:hypothetical protein B0A54_07135 [Friedmanniomyces endolithicus]
MSMPRPIADSPMRHHELVVAVTGMADMSGESGRQAEEPATWRTLMEPHLLTTAQVSILSPSAPPWATLLLDWAPLVVNLLPLAAFPEIFSPPGGCTAKYASSTAHFLYFETSPLEQVLESDAGYFARSSRRLLH